ncbi:hypothetical protein [Sulfitobacter aestuariivivens]|uniref:Adenylosuccinate lyase n=1 Tax=Sulfitobacter aestuariivivens TaxID=2766981 RepID=A0A927D5B7_9RHOB|nr:hypothetical protein [Sulfitobacter aestuariivivens]MBD3664513.1 hypothetical protein [Sulfitobacter aestuariivivens]
MKLKIAFVTALMLAPTVSLAMGCSHGKEKQAMSCAEGTTYDSATHACLPVST